MDSREDVEIEGRQAHVLALGHQRRQILQEGRQIGILHAVVPETKTKPVPEAGGERSELQQAERGVLQKKFGHRRQRDQLRPGTGVQRAALQLQLGRRGQRRRDGLHHLGRDLPPFETDCCEVGGEGRQASDHVDGRQCRLLCNISFVYQVQTPCMIAMEPVREGTRTEEGLGFRELGRRRAWGDMSGQRSGKGLQVSEAVRGTE